jgi:hypothetical protein
MVEEIDGCQRKWCNHIDRKMPLNVRQGKHIFITLLEDGGIGHSGRRWAQQFLYFQNGS